MKAQQFVDKLKNELDDSIGTSKLIQSVENVLPNLELRPNINYQQVTDKIGKQINSFIIKHREILKNLSVYTEDILRSSVSTDLYLYNKRNNENLIYNYHPPSGLHIPVDIYVNEPKIVKDIALSEKFNLVWPNIHTANQPNIHRLMYASVNGVLRFYPYKNIENASSSNLLYDVRQTEWYQNAVMESKNLLILLDTSGSTFGQTLNLMKKTAIEFISNLALRDKAILIQYSDKVELTKCFSHLMPMNYLNKKLLINDIQMLESNGISNFDNALETAFKILLSEENKSLCNKKIIIFTDSELGYNEEILKTYNDPLVIDIYVFAVSPYLIPITSLKHIACRYGGIIQRISSTGNIKPSVTNIFKSMNRPMDHYTDRKIYISLPSQSFLDKEITNILSMPVYNMSSPTSDLIGVIAMEIKTSTISNIGTDLVYTSDYKFGIDREGYILFYSNTNLLKNPISVNDLEFKNLDVERIFENGNIVVKEKSRNTDYFYLSILENSIVLFLAVPDVKNKGIISKFEDNPRSIYTVMQSIDHNRFSYFYNINQSVLNTNSYEMFQIFDKFSFNGSRKNYEMISSNLYVYWIEHDKLIFKYRFIMNSINYLAVYPIIKSKSIISFIVKYSTMLFSSIETKYLILKINQELNFAARLITKKWKNSLLKWVVGGIFPNEFMTNIASNINGYDMKKFVIIDKYGQFLYGKSSEYDKTKAAESKIMS
ncbi:hypothetical protein A3Q56_05051 [Intoshia linei]|uniref:VWFA domain-containing protein n=1 Tax=Intoshia linei TaxID=1819745 RepID=A0A177AYY3_9BILA|nr:hypothetical protein A3Q56_05051 [Intoshia linei]